MGYLPQTSISVSERDQSDFTVSENNYEVPVFIEQRDTLRKPAIDIMPSSTVN